MGQDVEWYMGVPFKRETARWPKFKVGDRVRLTRNTDDFAVGDTGKVESIVSDTLGERIGVVMDNRGLYRVFRPDGLEPAPAADCAVRNGPQELTRALFIERTCEDDALGIIRPAIVAIVKNGQPHPANRPYVHANVAAATVEAERLARNNPGQEFAVYQRVCARVAEVSYEMKDVA